MFLFCVSSREEHLPLLPCEPAAAFAISIPQSKWMYSGWNIITPKTQPFLFYVEGWHGDHRIIVNFTYRFAQTLLQQQPASSDQSCCVADDVINSLHLLTTSDQSQHDNYVQLFKRITLLHAHLLRLRMAAKQDGEGVAVTEMWKDVGEHITQIETLLPGMYECWRYML